MELHYASISCLKKWENTKHVQVLTKTDFYNKGMLFSKIKQEVSAASLFSRKHGSGVPIRIKAQLVKILYLILYPIGIGGVNYIVLALQPVLGPCIS